MSVFLISAVVLFIAAWPMFIFADATPTLYPNGQGFYAGPTSWTGDESDVDETGTPSCGSSDGNGNVATSTAGKQESVDIDLSSIPNGATVTSVEVFVTDQGATETGGSYQTLVRVNSNLATAGADHLTTTSTSVCTPKSQVINIVDFIKTGTTDLEVGVVKTGNDTKTVRIGTIRTVVTYTPLTITASAGAGGSVSPSGTAVVETGDTPTYTSTSSVGNILSDVLVDGVSQGRLNSYTFSSIGASHTIDVSFDSGWSQPGDFDNNDSVSNPQGAFTSNNSYAVFNADGDDVEYDEFGLSIPSGAIINGIEVALEGNRSSSRTLLITLSWDNAASFTASKVVAFPSDDDSTVVIGGASDTWGHAWASNEFSDANFQVRVDEGGESGNVKLDQIQVKVHFIPPGRIVVDKVTDPSGDVQLFSFDATGGAYDDFALTDTDAPNDQALAPGNYSISETVPGGWTQSSAVCVSSMGDSETIGAIELDSEETVICTFFNTKNGSLVVRKTTDPEEGEGEFEFNGSMGGILEEDGEEMSFEVIPGEYDVTEAVLEGWDLTDIFCDDDNSSGNLETRTAHYVIGVGEEVVCTFNNTKRGSVTVTKLADPIFGPFTFSLVSDSLSQAIEAIYQNGLFDGSGDNSHTFWNLLAGDYSIEESVPSDWFGIQTSSCEGWGDDSSSSINLLPGEHVDCVFNNTQFGTIGGVKFEDKNGNGIRDEGEQDLQGWNITLDYLYGESEPEGEFPVVVATNENGSYLFSDLVPGTYSVCEERRLGWEQTLPNSEGGEEGEDEEEEYDEYIECGEDGFGYEVYLSAGENNLDNHFGNFETVKVSGYKWHDLNADGVWQREDIENPEPALEEWEIHATRIDDESKTAFTDEAGYYEFNFDAGEAGEWEISEVLPEPETGGWIRRYPTDPGTYSVNILSGTNEENFNFGNQLDEVMPQSRFDNDLNYEVIDVEIVELSLTGSSFDDHSGVQNATLSVYQLGGPESVENYPAQSFFDVFNGLSCPSSEDRQIPIEIVALELVSVNPATVSWAHNWISSEPGTYCFEVSAEDQTGNAENTAVAGPLAYVPVANISDEITGNVTETGFTVEWTTDKPATSRVIYDTISHSELGEAPNYGYAFSTPEQDVDPNKVLEHSVALTDLTPDSVYYYRAVSAASPESVGEEGSASTPPQPSNEDEGGGNENNNGGGGGGGGGGAGDILNGPGLTPTPSPTSTPTPSLTPSPIPSVNIAGASTATGSENVQESETAPSETVEAQDGSTDSETPQEEPESPLLPAFSGTETGNNFVLAALSGLIESVSLLWLLVLAVIVIAVIISARAKKKKKIRK